MKNLVYTAGAAALAAIAAFFGTLAWVTGQVPDQARGIRADANLQLLFLRGELAHQVEAARADVLARAERQIDAAQVRILELADRRLRDTLGIVDRRLGDSLDRVDTITTAAVGTANGIVELAGDVREQLRPALGNMTSITAHADEASAVLFRRDALPAQLLGVAAAAKVTLGETAQTMRTVRDAAPLFVAQGQQLVGNSTAVAANINRLTKPHWYDRLLGYGLNGALLYRQLNPATSLTVKGAQFVSGQK